MTSRILIIAYGNPLRGDDGIAWRAAERLRETFVSAGSEIICVHQLTPELADSVSHAKAVIFLDARQNGRSGHVSWRRVPLEAESPVCSHTLTPAQLMALSGLLYELTPEAYEVSVVGESFGHSEELSHTLKNALPQIVEVVDRLTKRIR